MPQKAAKYTRSSPEERRRELIDATMRCLGQHGPGAATIQKICAEAGVSLGLISHYFGGKDGLMAETYQAMADGMAETISATVDREGLPPAERLRKLVEMTFRPPFFSDTNISVWLALWAMARTTPALRDRHARLYEDYRRYLRRMFDDLATERQLEIDSQRLAIIFTGLEDGLWLDWCLDPEAYDPADAEAACLDVLERYFGPL